MSKWYDADNVDAVFDVSNSSVMLAVQEIARKAQKLVVVSTGATSDFTGKACSLYGRRHQHQQAAELDVARPGSGQRARPGPACPFGTTSNARSRSDIVHHCKILLRG